MFYIGIQVAANRSNSYRGTRILLHETETYKGKYAYIPTVSVNEICICGYEIIRCHNIQ